MYRLDVVYYDVMQMRMELYTLGIVYKLCYRTLVLFVSCARLVRYSGHSLVLLDVLIGRFRGGEV